MKWVQAMMLSMMVGLFLLSNLANAASVDAMEWLKKMNHAANSLDYSGEFVMVKGAKIGSMKISHLGEASGGMQKLSSLNGSMREIIQSSEEIACVLPDQNMGVREKKQMNNTFNLALADDIDAIASHYKVFHIGSARVANRKCEEIQVKPKDDYRYGYKLCIDSENQLLLRSILSDYEGEVLESYMFVAIDFGEVDLMAFESATPEQSLLWESEKPMMASGQSAGATEGEAIKWQITKNNIGFDLAHYIERMSPVMKENITHLVLSDGLANISVFISKADGQNNNKASANLNLGSLHSFSREAEDYKITVIGEVPQRTVELIALHVKRS